MENYPDIEELLPQRRPFLMVDRLEHYDPVVTETSFLVKSDCVFVEDGHLSVPGMTENMAQTCAARMGWVSRMESGPVKLGFIGAVSSFVAHRTPLVGEKLTTRIEVKQEVFNITLVRASVLSGTEVLAESDMKIALSDISKSDE